ncbi:hypothetical protein [Aliiroseovarius sp. PrR006]|uniref:hypothetical protein n=1 Tax=Aliiroseovarius sp. PrR006 TaxID=2706883 RepID=UPI0013D0BC84|nr:hypothetical protein [Aliiroseovarius sp. PrR006]NDW52561.1 hypothetical protein [Aliiroseovarius sp. PrR006]
MCTPRPSPLQNRVLPTGEIVADPARGMFTGNRGILPFTKGGLGVSRWKHPHWIICDLTHPKGRYHGPMPARAWTPLFFLDEAVGLAAGHRPCAYCRPDAYRAFKSAWAKAHAPMGHQQIDQMLHKARVTRSRQQVRHMADCSGLPDGTFILLNQKPHLLRGARARCFSKHEYSTSTARPNAEVQVLTPAPTVAALRAGFSPKLHSSA